MPQSTRPARTLRRAAPSLAALALAHVLAVAPPAAWAIDDTTFLEATTLLMAAQDSGGSARVSAAVERWSALLAAEPTNPLVRAYAGSAVTMQATTTMLPWRKMSFTEDGLAQIDKALALLSAEHDTRQVAAVPMSLLVRYTAATTFLALPSLFNRGPRGRDELQAVLRHPQFEVSPAAFKGTVWLRAGRLSAQDGDKAGARRYLEQVVQAKVVQSDTARRLMEQL